MLLKTEITRWMAEPVTKEMLRLFEEHQTANKIELDAWLLEGNILDPDQQKTILRLQGQIYTWIKVLNIKEELLELSEEYPEVNQDEV